MVFKETNLFPPENFLTLFSFYFTASNTVTVVVEDLVGSEAQQRGIGEKRENKVPYQNVTLAGTPLGSAASSSSLNLVGAASATSLSSSQVRAGGISQSQNSLFQLEDKKAESQSTKKVQHEQQLQLLKKAALEVTTKSSGTSAAAASMASSTASLVLS